MCNIRVGRYKDAELRKEWQGWIEPEDESWIAFIRADGTPEFYLERDESGAVILRNDEGDFVVPAVPQGQTQKQKREEKQE